MNYWYVFYFSATVMAIWAAGFGLPWYLRRRKLRMLDQQIRDNVVPVDYDQVTAAAREMNKADDVSDPNFKGAPQAPEFRRRASDLKRLRTRVAMIRVNGYDRAQSDIFAMRPFDQGVLSSPYPKGSGEAKQWVRGYCMGASVTDPKQYMDRA